MLAFFIIWHQIKIELTTQLKKAKELIDWQKWNLVADSQVLILKQPPSPQKKETCEKGGLKLIRTTTITISHGTNIMRPPAIFIQEPFQDMHSMTAMPTGLTNNDGVVKRVYKCNNKQKK